MEVKYQKENDLVVCYWKNEDGYRIHGFETANAKKFCGVLKKFLSSDAKTGRLVCKTVFAEENGKTSIVMKREEAELLHPALLLELQYITGKKERPKDEIFDLQAYLDSK